MDFLARYKYSGFLLLVLGLVAGYAAGQWGDKRGLSIIDQSLVPISEKGTSYAFVHPLLAYRVPEATVFGDYVSLKSSFQSIIDSEVSAHRVTKVALYFRDLDAARWVGIAQDDVFYPASLLKVPVLIAYLKEAEKNSSILNKKIAYDPAVIPTESFTAPSTLVTSRDYTIKTLLNRMIIDSDNGATFTLLNDVNPEFLRAVYTAIGIQDPGNGSTDYQISARSYGLFFRVLYNATYLSQAYSEQALRLLSQTTFVDGLVAGVPKGIVVAHKYGEHIFSENGVATSLELSDCGIVYYPEHPYLLCVMTSAKGFAEASATIAKISSAAYDAIQQQYATAK
ncbi:MAG: class A beta-lactamase-related serine hydrolase [Candidatus Kaiserbacteria bacterium]|nr:class A beta-lactamase-related serine hydrolase [Candidatus Kaiserbacteria bacterium]